MLYFRLEKSKEVRALLDMIRLLHYLLAHLGLWLSIPVLVTDIISASFVDISDVPALVTAFVRSLQGLALLGVSFAFYLLYRLKFEM